MIFWVWLIPERFHTSVVLYGLLSFVLINTNDVDNAKPTPDDDLPQLIIPPYIPSQTESRLVYDMRPTPCIDPLLFLLWIRVALTVTMTHIISWGTCINSTFGNALATTYFLFLLLIALVCFIRHGINT
jgi:hypothetical protein